MIRSKDLGPHVLDLDCEAEADRIADWMVRTVGKTLRRRGAVIAMSGGVDSSVCAALAVRAFGSQRAYGLLLPERDSSTTSTEHGALVASHLRMHHEVKDISPVLKAIGCYEQRDAAIRVLFPSYADDWKCKIAIAGSGKGGITFFRLVVHSPSGDAYEKRLSVREYLKIVAATNYKQRIRKAVEYFHADRLNYAVIGTPNRLEYDQGFFVKNGDGAADLKPIAHLYKTQVYALARHLDLPDIVCDAMPTTDTYSLVQGQDEFYFVLPYRQMDLALWAFNHAVSASEAASALGLSAEQVRLAYSDIEAKRQATRYLHTQPLLVEPMDEVIT